MTLFTILIIAALVTFGYLVYRVGWAEAAAAVVALYGGIAAAVWAFVGSF
jgi:hypothetical protein